MPQNYVELQRHLDRVRWAWRRAKALQGLSAVVIEGAGMFLIFALVDHFYQMPQSARVLVLAAIGIVLGILFALHVGRPLTRKISDDQIALYIEEHQQQADGALLTATTFGREKSGASNAVSRFIVETVMQSAVTRAGSLKLSELLDLSKLRKYGIAALVVMLLLGLSAVKFSNLFGRSVNRLLLPWEVSEDDRKNQRGLSGEPAIQFELSTDAGDRLLRGAAITIKARLSIRPGAGVPVELKYRAGGTDFHSVKLDEIEELNTFAVRLPDINDDLHFYVQAGNDQSEQRSVSVYDRIELKSLQITQSPPAYTQLEATTQNTDSGDITALAGTRIKISAIGSGPLASGVLTFNDGKTVELKPDSAAENVAGEFVLEKDATYTISAVTRDGQSVGPTSSFALKALVDEPPTVTLDAPGSDLEVHRFAEVDFTVKASDDVGLGSVALVYTLSSDDTHPVTLPFKLDGKPGPGERTASLTVALGDLSAGVQAGDSLMYYVSAKDTKGQETVTDLFTIQVRPFEVLVALPKKGGHAPDHESFASLLQFIATAWNIHVQQPHASEAEYNQRCDALAVQIMKVDAAHIFGPANGPATESAKKQIDAAYKSVLAGVDALKHHDAMKAVTLLRQGLMMFKRASVSSDAIAGALGGKQYSSFAGGDPMRQSLGSVEIAPPPIHEDDPPFFNNPVKPDYLRQINMQDAKNVREAAVKLKKQQQQLNKEARKLADQQAGGGAGEDEQEQQANPEKPGAPKPVQPAEVSGHEPKPHNTGDDKPDENGKPEPRNTPPNGAAAQAQPQKPGQPQDGHAQPAVPGAAAQEANAKPAGGDELADRHERLAALQRDQERLAREVAKMTQDLGAKNANGGNDKDLKAATDDLRKTADEMQNAANQIKAGNLQRAAAHGEQAVKDLNLAEERLNAGQFDQLEQAVAAAEDRAMQVDDNQKKIREATQRVLDDARQRNPAANGSKPDLNAQDLQKLRGVARWQAENQKNAENLEEYIGELGHWAENAKQKDTADALRKAGRAMKLDKVGDNMVNIAVDLGMNDLDGAAEAQAKLDKALNKVAGHLQDATGGLAQTGEQKMQRALGDAKRLLDKVQELADANVAPRDNNPGPDQVQAAKPNGDAKGDAGKNDLAKHGEPKNGDDTHVAQKDEKSAAGKENAAKKKPMTADEKREAEADLFHGTVRLARRLEQDKLALNAQPQLGEMARDEKSFAEMFKDGKKTRLDNYLAAVKTVSTTLEGKLEITLKARRLSAGQREQTPAQYREMVNSYYQRLATE